MTVPGNLIGNGAFVTTNGGLTAGGALQFGTSANTVLSAATSAQLDVNPSGYSTLALHGAIALSDVVASAVGTGAKTISNAADSSTNFGHYFTVKLGATSYYIPCSTVAPT